MVAGGLWASGFGLWALGFGLWALGFGLWPEAGGPHSESQFLNHKSPPQPQAPCTPLRSRTLTLLPNPLIISAITQPYSSKPMSRLILNLIFLYSWQSSHCESRQSHPSQYQLRKLHNQPRLYQSPHQKQNELS